MDNKRFNLASCWEEPYESCQRRLHKEIPFRVFMEITKGCNPNRQFRLLEERAARIRENQATIQAIEERLSQKKNMLIPSGSQGVSQPNSPVASQSFGIHRSVTRVTILQNLR
ncbi:hypothetical protein O181_003378 [Austropuccinia psidii MF-1]|uniref:Uncharacterized protein n=1 Tax=Austropuccinia psidii MF-1 TaxID=1389203 RepID=A0A9Q3BEK2_9BASI|nr:hypothetical protein [Austropuccinia psidii MF-1]